MNRRQFLGTISIVTASSAIAGCIEGGSGEAAADVSVTVVRNAPENAGPFEDSAVPVESEKSDALDLTELVFQRAGQKGIVVAGDATNTSDRPLENVTIDVTLYDQNEAEDDILDSTSVQTEHERLDADETWQWAATFDEEPEFQIDSYSVEATANYASEQGNATTNGSTTKPASRAELHRR